jgi:hypothetical protein
MDTCRAVLVAGPFDGLAVPDPGSCDMVVGAHLYDRTADHVQHRGQPAYIYLHRDDCCDPDGEDADPCE